MENIQTERSRTVLEYASNARWAVNLHFVLLAAVGALVKWSVGDLSLLISAIEAAPTDAQVLGGLLLAIALFFPALWIVQHQYMLEIGHSPSEGEEISEEDIRWCRLQVRRMSMSIMGFLFATPVSHLITRLIM